jgi:hypothetical protein
MARPGAFDPQLIPLAWFDPQAVPGGWFDESLVGGASAASGELFPPLLASANTFYAATVAPGAVTLAPGRHDNLNEFFGPTVTGGSITLSPPLLVSANAFYAPSVYDPGAIVPSSIRFDIATGRLVKIINASVVITL